MFSFYGRPTGHGPTLRVAGLGVSEGYGEALICRSSRDAPAVNGATSFIAVVAHMEDPATRTCEPYPGLETDQELSKVTVVLDCRTTFVATSLVRIGQ